MPPRSPKNSKTPNDTSRNNNNSVFLYPTSHDFHSLNEESLALKIARHSHCSRCDDCFGLVPDENVTVILDTAALDNTNTSELAGYISSCRCGHSVRDHAILEHTSPEEYARRGRVAIRLDELLDDGKKLLNFEYEDDDIVSLRKQMRLPGDTLSPLSDVINSPDPEIIESRKHSRSSSGSLQPPNKRPRMSVSDINSDYSSPLSNEDESKDGEDEEDSASVAQAIAPEEEHDQDQDQDQGQDHDRDQDQDHDQDQDISESDDEEERPLAVTNGNKPNIKTVPRYGGKKSAGHMTVAGTAPAPASTGPHSKAGLEGLKSKSKGKPEELGEQTIDRLASGVTVDTEGDPTQPHGGQLKHSQIQSMAGLIKIVSIDPTFPDLQSPRNLVLLTNLKCLFQKQLPKMPREYITRLVFDKNSHCMAIIKRGLKVVGGICYRVFDQRGFAEIVFFATTGVVQDKGYGSLLMNHFKMHIKETYPKLDHFLTYADNYAVGYFKKQGFSKDITLDRSVWAGYIKDYEGGTIMQCTMLDKVDYLRTRDILAEQREAILTKIRKMSKSHIVYPPLSQFLNAKPGEEVTVNWQTVPGLAESGWTPSMTEPPRLASKNPQHSLMVKWLTALQNHSAAWPFLHPVNPDEVIDYYDVVKNPMDFGTMENKLERNAYPDIESFLSDANLVFDNCMLYNPEDSVYVKRARKLAKYLKDLVASEKK